MAFSKTLGHFRTFSGPCTEGEKLEGTLVGMLSPAQFFLAINPKYLIDVSDNNFLIINVNNKIMLLGFAFV